MRIDPNRLLVGGARVDERRGTRTADLIVRRRLAEIIVAMVIIGGCLYLFIPVFMGTAESANRAVCVTRLRRLAQALEMYQEDHDGQYAPAVNWVRALYPYVVRPSDADEAEGDVKRRVQAVGVRQGVEVFSCPSEAVNEVPRRRNAPLGTTLSSYTYRQPLPVGSSTLPFAWDLNGGTGVAAHANGGNVGYLDGRVAWLPASRWSRGDQP